jgi:hypothetical protein
LQNSQNLFAGCPATPIFSIVPSMIVATKEASWEERGV